MPTKNIAGNVYDKYRTRNPLARFLTDRFTTQVRTIVEQHAPVRILEVGCGEGYLIVDVFSQCSSIHEIAACDLESGQLLPEVHSLAQFYQCSAYDLPFDDDSFDLVCCLEVLEHLDDPDAALREICRVARDQVLISVPREPLWRILNVCRGKYWRAMGNTPGHVQHFSKRSLLQLLGRYLTVQNVHGPLPWTIVECRRHLDQDPGGQK